MGMGLARWHVGKGEEVRIGRARGPETQRPELALKPEKLSCRPAHVAHGRTSSHGNLSEAHSSAPPALLPTGSALKPAPVFGGNDQPELGRHGRGFISS